MEGDPENETVSIDAMDVSDFEGGGELEDEEAAPLQPMDSEKHDYHQQPPPPPQKALKHKQKSPPPHPPPHPNPRHESPLGHSRSPPGHPVQSSGSGGSGRSPPYSYAPQNHKQQQLRVRRAWGITCTDVSFFVGSPVS